MICSMRSSQPTPPPSPPRSMQQSVLLCISTILDSGNHCAFARRLPPLPATCGALTQPSVRVDSKMMEMTDAFGKKVFETIQITLVCQDCLLGDAPEKCRHKLASMPRCARALPVSTTRVHTRVSCRRWLSSQKVETVRCAHSRGFALAKKSTHVGTVVKRCTSAFFARTNSPPFNAHRALLSEDPAMLLRESLGISADGSEKAFSSVDIQRLLVRVGPQIIHDVRRPDMNVSHVTVAVDPSGGGASAFSIASICQDSLGFSHVRRLPFFVFCVLVRRMPLRRHRPSKTPAT